MKSKSTLWPLDPHTVGKHLVLKEYLNAWLPVLGSWNGRILFIDGFAGPGEYENGEDGSPLIALKCLRDHSAQKHIKSEVGFIFIEKDEARKLHLDSIIADKVAAIDCQCWVDVIHGSFDEEMTEVLDKVDVQNLQLAPSFVMIDPFGVSDTPMSVVSRILASSRSEVYVSFMYQYIDRFKTTPEFEKHLDGLFGTPSWRDGITIQDQIARKDFFFDLYSNQLRISGASQVVRFELYEGNSLIYAIFFATKHLKGSNFIKQAIWKVAPWGDFAFRGTRSSQLTLGLSSPDFTPLRDAIINEFGSKNWVSIGEVEDFVSSDKTDFHTGQIRRHVLIPLEEKGALLVDETTRKMKKRYPNGTLLRFI